MNESILNSVKKLLGIDSGYTHYDQDIIVHINTVFAILRQMGVGPSSGFNIYGAAEKWSDYLGSVTNLELVKTYIFMKVKKMFDPSASSSISGAYDEIISELEWRISIEVDPGEEENQNEA